MLTNFINKNTMVIATEKLFDSEATKELESEIIKINGFNLALESLNINLFPKSTISNLKKTLVSLEEYIDIKGADKELVGELHKVLPETQEDILISEVPTVSTHVEDERVKNIIVKKIEDISNDQLTVIGTDILNFAFRDTTDVAITTIEQAKDLYKRTAKATHDEVQDIKDRYGRVQIATDALNKVLTLLPKNLSGVFYDRSVSLFKDMNSKNFENLKKSKYQLNVLGALATLFQNEDAISSKEYIQEYIEAVKTKLISTQEVSEDNDLNNKMISRLDEILTNIICHAEMVKMDDIPDENWEVVLPSVEEEYTKGLDILYKHEVDKKFSNLYGALLTISEFIKQNPDQNKQLIIEHESLLRKMNTVNSLLCLLFSQHYLFLMVSGLTSFISIAQQLLNYQVIYLNGLIETYTQYELNMPIRLPFNKGEEFDINGVLANNEESDRILFDSQEDKDKFAISVPIIRDYIKAYHNTFK